MAFSIFPQTFSPSENKSMPRFGAARDPFGTPTFMKTYTCTCGQLLFFENISCTTCSREVGFLPDLICASSLDPADNGLFAATTPEARGALYKKCANYAQDGICN